MNNDSINKINRPYSEIYSGIEITKTTCKKSRKHRTQIYHDNNGKIKYGPFYPDNDYFNNYDRYKTIY